MSNTKFIKSSRSIHRSSQSIVNKASVVSAHEPESLKPILEFSDFGDAACGEPPLQQHVILDFTPNEMTDNEITQKKICDFWEFIKSATEIKNLKVNPEKLVESLPLIPDNQSEVSKKPEETVVDTERTACSMLKEVEEKRLINRAFETRMTQSLCVLDLSEYSEDGEDQSFKQQKRIKRAPIICRCTKSCKPCPVKKPPPSKSKTLCQTLDEWDNKHPLSKEPPGHPPTLQHCIIQRQVLEY